MAASLLVYPTASPSRFVSAKNGGFSFGHFSEHLEAYFPAPLWPSTKIPLIINSSRTFYSSSKLCSYSLLSPPPRGRFSRHLVQPLRYSISNTSSSLSDAPFVKNLRKFSFDSMKATISQMTPFSFVKWTLLLSIAIAATKWTLNLLFSPFFWMYFSWTWLFWPWYIAISLAIYGLYGLTKHLKGEASIIEQLSIVTSALTWLTLVPPGFFNGFLEGWPFIFFFLYHYFFFFNVSVRKRLYGDLYPREHDSKWDVSLPDRYKVLFCAGVTVGHWLAAFEGPQLQLIPGGWSNFGIWVLIMQTMFMQYNSTLYLAKYSEKVVVPTAVVQFGPNRWVRHPMYASTMLLFVTYFIALRAPLSSLFIVAVCLVYYGQKAKLEEALMVETFGEGYKDYVKRVRYMLIPFVY